MPKCFQRQLHIWTDIWERQGVLCCVVKELKLSSNLVQVLNSDAPLPPQPKNSTAANSAWVPSSLWHVSRIVTCHWAVTQTMEGLMAWSSLLKQSQPGPNTRESVVTAEALCLLQSSDPKSQLKQWTPPLCQTIVILQPWVWRAYHKGLVGLPVTTLHKVWAYLLGNFGVVSEVTNPSLRPISSEMSVVAHKEIKSTLPWLLRFTLSAPAGCIKNTFMVAFDLKEKSGPFDGDYGIFIGVCWT